MALILPGALGGLAAVGSAIKDLVDKKKDEAAQQPTGGNKPSGGGTYTGMDMGTGNLTYSDGSKVPGSSYKPGGNVGSSAAAGVTHTPASGELKQYGGGNTALDSALKSWSAQYNAARAAGDAKGMQQASDEANKIRNQYGYVAVSAADDISKIAGQYHGMQLGGNGSIAGTAGGGAELPPVGDYSDLIEEMNQAAKEKALAELRAAFEKNVAGLDRTQAGLAPKYQDARNQAAGASEQAKRQFSEYAAATGLNSGAGGQAHLAMNSTLQGNLNQLSTAEASSLADLELQRSQTETDYNNAIAQAKASGDYQLAQQLYAEQVRVDEALRQQMMWQAQQDFQLQQQAWQEQQAGIANGQWDKQFQSGQEQWNQKWALQAAQELAQYGNFSGYEALGYTQEQIRSMQEAYEYQKQLAAMQAQGKSRGGGGGRAGKGSGMSLTTAKSAAAAGVFDEEVLSALRKEGYSDSMLTAIYGYDPYRSPFKDATGNSRYQGSGSLFTEKEMAQFLYSVGMNRSDNGRQTAIQDAFKEGKITEEQAKNLLRQYAIDF